MRRTTPPPAAKNNSKNSVSLQRFVQAQKGAGGCTPYSTAVSEIKYGKKISCWIWYVFPQVKDPARLSMNNEEYQIHNRVEACMFLKHEPSAEGGGVGGSSRVAGGAVPAKFPVARNVNTGSLRLNLLALCCTVMKHLATDKSAALVAESRKSFMAKVAGFDGEGASQVSKSSLQFTADGIMALLGQDNSHAGAGAERRSMSPPPQELHIGQLFSTMVDAKKCYHSVSTFALAAVECMESAPILNFFSEFLDVIVASLKIAEQNSARPGAFHQSKAVTESKKSMLLPSEQQEVTLAKEHPFAEYLSVAAGGKICAGLSPESKLFWSVLAAKRIVDLADPIILSRWNGEMAPVTVSSGLWPVETDKKPPKEEEAHDNDKKSSGEQIGGNSTTEDKWGTHVVL